MTCYQSKIRKHVVARLTKRGMDPQLVDEWGRMVVSELNTSITDATTVLNHNGMPPQLALALFWDKSPFSSVYRMLSCA